MFEKLRRQGYMDSHDRTQITMQELISSQKSYMKSLRQHQKLFPADLDKTVNAFSQSHASDQDWEHIQFEHKDHGTRQVGLEHLLS